MLLPRRDTLLEQFNRDFDKMFAMNDMDIMSNVEHTKDARVVYLDLPGVKREDVSVTLENQLIVVEAERKGFINGKYRKTFSIGGDLDIEKTSISLEDGVLAITIPLSEKVKPKVLRFK